MTNVYLVFEDGSVDLTADPSIKITNISKDMPVPKNEYTSFASSVGQRLVSHTLDAFYLTLAFDLKTQSRDDLILKETELRELFFREPTYYFAYEQEPGKLYPVAVDNIVPTSKGFFMSHFVVTFKVYKGCAFSAASTLSDFSLDEEWQFSQGLVSEDFEYTFKRSKFTIFNAGDFTVDPREHYLNIKVEGSSDGELTINNKTTKERFIYKPTLRSRTGDWLDLNGVYPKKNGVNCGIDTNHGLITLVPGINEIEIQNANEIKTSWDFNFLYK